MSIYLGFYRTTDGFRTESEVRARGGDTSIDPRFLQLVVDLPLRLPAGCSIVGSYGSLGASPQGLPNVMIVETDTLDHLTFITNYYTGFLNFQWTPASSVGSTKDQREQWRQSLQAPTAANR